MNSNSRLIKDGIDIFGKKIKIIKKDQKNSVCINNSSFNKQKFLMNANNLYLNNQDTKRKAGSSFSSKYLSKLIKEKFDSRSNIELKEKANQNVLFNKKDEIVEESGEPKNVNNEKPKYNILKFYNYILFLISLKKKHSNIQLFIDFRTKMISEENLILSNLNIDKLLQKYKKENSNNHIQELEGTQILNLNNG